MTLTTAKCFVVSGKVQGVFFRASTRQQALQLGIHGYAKNLSDGRVEVLAIGDTEAVSRLERWLWQGPPAARVDVVLVTDAVTENGNHNGFATW